jgi:hypothetical protein
MPMKSAEMDDPQLISEIGRSFCVVDLRSLSPFAVKCVDIRSFDIGSGAANQKFPNSSFIIRRFYLGAEKFSGYSLDISVHNFL